MPDRDRIEIATLGSRSFDDPGYKLYTLYTRFLLPQEFKTKSPDPSRICLDLPFHVPGAISRSSVASTMATPRSLPTNERARRQPSLLDSNWQPSLPDDVNRDHIYYNTYLYLLIIEIHLQKLIMTVLVPSTCDVTERHHNTVHVERRRCQGGKQV